MKQALHSHRLSGGTSVGEMLKRLRLSECVATHFALCRPRNRRASMIDNTSWNDAKLILAAAPLEHEDKLLITPIAQW